MQQKEIPKESQKSWKEGNSEEKKEEVFQLDTNNKNTMMTWKPCISHDPNDCMLSTLLSGILAHNFFSISALQLMYIIVMGLNF